MRIYFLGKTGNCIVDRIKQSYFLIEEPDGYHIMAEKGIFKDINGKYDNIMVFFEDHVSAFGYKLVDPDVTDKTDKKPQEIPTNSINFFIAIVSEIKKQNQKISISKNFGRIWRQISDNLGTIIAAALLIGALIYWAYGMMQ
jgi:hypothetical protein